MTSLVNLWAGSLLTSCVLGDIENTAQRIRHQYFAGQIRFFSGLYVQAKVSLFKLSANLDFMSPGAICKVWLGVEWLVLAPLADL